MCGIALIPKDSDLEVTKDVLTHLQRMRGGNGQGVGYFLTPNLTIKKDKDQDTDESMDIISDNIGNMISDSMLFHARRCSKGEDESYNNQPLAISRRRCMVHNGTWFNYKDWARLMAWNSYLSLGKIETVSDSMIIALAIRHFHGLDFLDHIVEKGVFLDYRKDKTILKLLTGDFEACTIDGKWYFASKFQQRHNDHVEFIAGTTAVLSSDGYQILSGGVSERTLAYSNVRNSGQNNSQGLGATPSSYDDEEYANPYCHSGRYTEGNRSTSPPLKKISNKPFKISHKEKGVGKIITICSEFGTPLISYMQKNREILTRDVDIPAKNFKNKGKLSREDEAMLRSYYKEISDTADDDAESFGNAVLYTTYSGIEDEKLALYAKATHNMYSPDNPDILIEFCGGYNATLFKGILMYMIKSSKSLEEDLYQDFITYYYGKAYEKNKPVQNIPWTEVEIKIP